MRRRQVGLLKELEQFLDIEQANYRPINLLPLFGKLLEVLINVELVHYLLPQSLFSDKYYDFRFSRLTADVLTIIAESLYHSLNKNCEARIVALDI